MSVDAHLSFFRFSDILNYAVLNICRQVLCGHVFIFPGCKWNCWIVCRLLSQHLFVCLFLALLGFSCCEVCSVVEERGSPLCFGEWISHRGGLEGTQASVAAAGAQY